MQQTLDIGFWQSARIGGVLRYHLKSLGKSVLLILAVLFGAQLLSLVFPILTGNPYPYLGVYADQGVTMIVTLICACVVAGRSTRFLLRFGTSRFSVWLGNLVGIWAGMIALLLGTLLLSILLGGLVHLLATALPQRFTIEPLFADVADRAIFSHTLRASLASLPQAILTVVEWGSIFYLLGCCLRRQTGLTLAVVIGLPLLLMLLTLIPAVRQAADVVERANEQQMMLLGVRWMKVLMDVLSFIENQWPWIQLGGAAVSLPLSYLCMRGYAAAVMKSLWKQSAPVAGCFSLYPYAATRSLR